MASRSGDARSGFVLGISAFYHDSAACLLSGDRIVAAAQEERFTRVKGDESFPVRASRYCLDEAGIVPADLDAVVFYEKPLLKFERLIETYLDIAPRGLSSFRRAAPLWLKDRLYTERHIRSGLGGYRGKLLYTEHHEAHAASAYFPSPFDEAAILTIDGVGEWATATIGVGRGSQLELLEELRFPDSLGLLYSAFTYHAGFRVNSGEYKLMGLAPFGSPRYVERIYSDLLRLADDGSFTLNQKFFDYRGGLRMTNRNFDRLFDGPPRSPEAPLTQREMDLACSVQRVCEEVVLRMSAYARRLTGLEKLCLAGGVALNAVANGLIAREALFNEVWVQPAAGDAGGALGAAYCAVHKYFGYARKARDGCDSMSGSFLGPAYTPDQVRAELRVAGAEFDDHFHGDVGDIAADAISDGKVVGWFQGRMEFGPRALGARSILADARNPEMQSTLNQKIKFREGFRPFAPSVLAERAGEYFDIRGPSPYMTFVVPVRESRRIEPVRKSAGLAAVSEIRSDIPAVTHLDYSARVQTVTREQNPAFHDLLSAFATKTGCPLIINTSFNVRGEPIVATPTDAFACFARTAIDMLAIGPFVLHRDQQSKRALTAAAESPRYWD